MAGHDVDIPVTDLDADEDDIFNLTDQELDPSVLQESFEGDENYPRSDKPNFFANIKKSWSKWGSSGYSTISKSAANGIELRNTSNADVDSFDLSDDEFLIRRQSDTLYQRTLEKLKKYISRTVILILSILVIVLTILLLTRGSKAKPEPKLKKIQYFNGTHVFYPTTIFISLDGFHPHYISPNLTPNLDDLFSNGYGAPFMIPSFPSSTFPNHWSMVTGLYPQNHGIVGNSFYDPDLKRQFINVIPEKSLDPVFWGGEPIWSTAEQNNVRSAIHMYPGSEVKFSKWNPTEVDKFNGSETLESKLSRITGWLDRELNDRPELIISYVPTIDSLGHKFGIKGKELEEGLNYVDSFIGDIKKNIEGRNLTDIVNFVIVSDHGMAPTSNDRLIYLDDILNTTKIEYIDGWPLFGIRPFPEFKIEDVFSELQINFKNNSGYKIYLREDLPAEFKFGGSKSKANDIKYYERVAPIWVIPDVGYSITTHDDMERKGGDYTPKGTHGYNNSEVLMRAVFLGNGPFFNSRISELGRKIKPFQNIEVYNILCETLDIKPVPNDGNSNVFSDNNLLESDWKDPFSYPNVDFDVDGVLKADSSFDNLFKNEQIRLTTTLKGSSAEVSSTKDKSSETPSHISEEPGKISYTLTEENLSTAHQLEEPQEPATVAEPSPTSLETSDNANEDGDDDNDDKPKNGFFDKISEIAEEVLDDVENVGEEIGEALEDAFESFVGGDDDEEEDQN